MPESQRSFRINIAASWSVYALRILIGFILMPYVIHVLGDAQYGFWLFINSIAGYAGLMYFGFGATISRYVAKYQANSDWKRLNEVVSLVFAIYSLMACVALLLTAGLMVAAPALSSWEGHSLWEIRLVFALLGINVAAGLVGSVFGGVLIGARRFDWERLVYCLSDIGRLILILTLLRREWGLVTIAAIYVVMTLLENMAYLWIAFRIIPQMSLSFRHLRMETFRTCFTFSSFAFLNAIASQLIYATDTVVIGTMLGSAAIVPYFVALRLCQIIKQPVEQISQICLPTAGALQAQSQEATLRQLMVRSMGVTFLLTGGMFIGSIFFGQMLLDVWMGPGYSESQTLLLVLFSSQVVALPVGVLRAFLFGTGNIRFPTLVFLAEAIINLVLSLILCRSLGNLGVALGTAIPIFLFELFVLLPYGLRVLNLSVRQLWKEGIVPQIVPLACLAGYSFVVSQQISGKYPASWTLLIAITCGGGVALGAGWLWQQWRSGNLPRWQTLPVPSQPSKDSLTRSET